MPAVLVYFLFSVHESWLLVVWRFVAADDVGKQECPSKIQEVNVHNTTLCNDVSNVVLTFYTVKYL